MAEEIRRDGAAVVRMTSNSNIMPVLIHGLGI
jgi:hypothetical protein